MAPARASPGGKPSLARRKEMEPLKINSPWRCVCRAFSVLTVWMLSLHQRRQTVCGLLVRTVFFSCSSQLVMHHVLDNLCTRAARYICNRLRRFTLAGFVRKVPSKDHVEYGNFDTCWLFAGMIQILSTDCTMIYCAKEETERAQFEFITFTFACVLRADLNCITKLI